MSEDRQFEERRLFNVLADSWQIQDVSRNIDAFLHYQIAPAQTGPDAHPASYTMRTRSFPGDKWPRVGLNITLI
jgi:hypothetical protein